MQPVLDTNRARPARGSEIHPAEGNDNPLQRGSQQRCKPEDDVLDVEDGEPEGSYSIWPSQANSFLDGGSTTTILDTAKDPGDVMAMITTISLVYRRGIYLKMMALDNEQWQPIGRGTTFRVSSSDIAFQAVSARNNRTIEKISNRLVLKRNDSRKMAPSEMRSFIRELRVLDHFHAHPFIVDLRGVGWFHEFDDMMRPSPRPAILLEEAANTLDYLVGPDVSLAPVDQLTIFAQLTSAIEALHDAGVAHGDLKPGNVLLFSRSVNREGVQVNSYVAKLSDFGSAVFDNGERQPYPLGTKIFNAPEIQPYAPALVSFQEILRTDVWSLGLLFVVIVCGSFEILIKDHSHTSATSRIDDMRANVRQRMENSTSDSTLVKAIQFSIECCLQLQPSLRRLDRVTEILSSYLHLGHRFSQTGKIDSNLIGDLAISYENFKHVSGMIKDLIVRELELSTPVEDLRHPKAYWELGVIYLSRFTDPNASINKGLEMIRKSAEAGDARAKSMYRRLLQAFGFAGPASSDDVSTEWLEEAVRFGSQAAVVDLRKIDLCRTTQALAKRAEALYHPETSQDITDWDFSLSVSTAHDTPLHRAAATGREHHIDALLQLNVDIDARNTEGDTPLIAACKFGQVDAALLLLSRGAQASSRNQWGENALHFAWCLDRERSENAVRQLHHRGAALDDKAKRRPHLNAFDLLPMLPGTPMERAAGRRRADLVQLFHQLHNLMKPSNGSMMRRLLLWAARLHDHDLQEFLLRCNTEHQSYDPTLIPVAETRWLYKGQQRTLVDAACAGWISGAPHGCDLPLDFWLAASFRSQWKRVVRDSVTMLSQLCDARMRNSGAEGALLDQAIIWTFREAHHTAFTTVLALKYEWSFGKTSQLTTFETLKWRLSGLNVSLMQPQEAHLIDQIFVDVDRGTLAQQALLSGDRYMFRLLTKIYCANAALPFPCPQTKGSRIKTNDPRRLVPFMERFNAYSVLAYTEHRDLWFATELRRLRVRDTSPWDHLPFHDSLPRAAASLSHILYSPPLLHAVGTQFWAYVHWLTDTCASLEEKVNPHHDILGGIMATRCMPLISFFFRGCDDNLQGSTLIPRHYRDAGGFHVLDLFFQTRNFPVHVADRDGKELRDLTTDCYTYLLRKYPYAENMIPARPLYWIIPRLRMTLLHQAAEMSRSQEPDILIVLVKAWSLRQQQFPLQAWFSYLCYSPLDRFHGDAIAKVFSASESINLRHICPSLAWHRSVQSYICTTGLLAALLFQNKVIGRPERWNSQDVVAGENDMFDTRTVIFVLRSASSLLLLLTIAGCVAALRTLIVSFADAARLASQRRLQTWHIILVLGSTLAPLVYSVYLSWKAMQFMVSLKLETGWWWIPYVF